MPMRESFMEKLKIIPYNGPRRETDPKFGFWLRILIILVVGLFALIVLVVVMLETGLVQPN
jgi:hypothetical protein